MQKPLKYYVSVFKTLRLSWFYLALDPRSVTSSLQDKMNILLIAFGTRGDVQPVIAFGKGLRAAGHVVQVMAGANFRDWIISHGLDVAMTEIDVQAMMQSELGVAWSQARNPLDELRQMRELYADAGLQMARDMLHAAGWADLIVGGFTSDNSAQVIAHKLGKRYITHALQPLHPTKLGEATTQPVKAHGESILNYWSTQVAERMLFTVYDKPMNAFRAERGMPPHTRKSYYDTLHDVPALFAFSPQVVPRRKLTAANLSDGLRALSQKTAFCKNATQLGEAIRAEEGVANAVALLQVWCS